MDSSDWIALVSVVVAIVGIAFATWYGRRSAQHAGTSAQHARTSAEQAERSADEAKRMRELDAERREEERERWHEELGPDLPGEVVAEFRRNDRLGGGHGSLWGKVTFPRTYRVKAVARMGRSRSDLSVPMLVERGQAVEFQIEPWLPEQEHAKTGEIVFKVWPPVGGDDTPAWGCGCGRPTGGSLDGDGHWEQRVRVVYEKPQGPFMRYV